MEKLIMSTFDSLIDLLDDVPTRSYNKKKGTDNYTVVRGRIVEKWPKAASKPESMIDKEYIHTYENGDTVGGWIYDFNEEGMVVKTDTDNYLVIPYGEIQN